MTHDVAEMLCELIGVVFPLGEQDRPAALLDRRDDIVGDAATARSRRSSLSATSEPMRTIAFVTDVDSVAHIFASLGELDDFDQRVS